MLRYAIHTVEYDPVIKCQLASLNKLWGLVWCKFGHVAFKKMNHRNLRTPPCGQNVDTECRETLDAGISVTRRDRAVPPDPAIWREKNELLNLMVKL